MGRKVYKCYIFDSTGTFGTCNNGAITGRSMRVESNTSYLYFTICITCTNVPSCGVCILAHAVQTAVNDYTVKHLLNNPVYLYLNQIKTVTTKNCTQIGSNNSEMNIGKIYL